MIPLVVSIIAEACCRSSSDSARLAKTHTQISIDENNDDVEVMNRMVILYYFKRQPNAHACLLSVLSLFLSPTFADLAGTDPKNGIYYAPHTLRKEPRTHTHAHHAQSELGFCEFIISRAANGTYVREEALNLTPHPARVGPLGLLLKHHCDAVHGFQAILPSRRQARAYEFFHVLSRALVVQPQAQILADLRNRVLHLPTDTEVFDICRAHRPKHALQLDRVATNDNERVAAPLKKFFEETVLATAENDEHVLVETNLAFHPRKVFRVVAECPTKIDVYQTPCILYENIVCNGGRVA